MESDKRIQRRRILQFRHFTPFLLPQQLTVCLKLISLNTFERGPPKEHSCEILSKVSQWIRMKCQLKLNVQNTASLISLTMSFNQSIWIKVSWRVSMMEKIRQAFSYEWSFVYFHFVLFWYRLAAFLFNRTTGFRGENVKYWAFYSLSDTAKNRIIHISWNIIKNRTAKRTFLFCVQWIRFLWLSTSQ